MEEHKLDLSSAKIVLLEGVNESAVDILTDAGFENIEYHKKSPASEEKLISLIHDASFIGIRSRTELNAHVIAQAKDLLAIGCFCIGTNQVDLMAALNQGVVVFNAPYSNTRSVAELVIAQSIMLMRNIPEKNALMHRNIWQKTASNSNEVRGKTLGIIGYGNIGSQLSVMAESLGLQVLFYDIVNKLPLGNSKQVYNLNELLANSDIVTLHVPESESTVNLIGETEIANMKVGSVLINSSRGNVVELDALYAALDSNHLKGAAIDVYPVEPKSNDEEFEISLNEFDNVILTPHIGGSTSEAQENIGAEVAKKIIKYANNGSTETAVNFPEVSLPSYPGKNRLLHIHKNVPGVLNKINQVFAKNHINISAQFLQTNSRIGYVVMDIDAASSELALQELSSIEETIKLRILC